jgi:phosphoglycolate phosphatase-like HAD superfamily hydrolase
LNGFVWHAYHDTLCSYLNIEVRKDIIRNEKPEEEISLRLKLMKPIKNTRALPKELREHFKSWEEIKERANKIYEKMSKLKGNPNKKKEAYEAFREWGKLASLNEKYYYESPKLFEKYRKQLEDLHKKDCAEAKKGKCPWDGKSIFPRRVV